MSGLLVLPGTDHSSPVALGGAGIALTDTQTRTCTTSPGDIPQNCVEGGIDRSRDPLNPPHSAINSMQTDTLPSLTVLSGFCVLLQSFVAFAQLIELVRGDLEHARKDLSVLRGDEQVMTLLLRWCETEVYTAVFYASIRGTTNRPVLSRTARLSCGQRHRVTSTQDSSTVLP